MLKLVKIPKKYHAEIVAEASKLLQAYSRELPIIRAGLARRPKPGSKRRATDALFNLIDAHGDLRSVFPQKVMPGRTEPVSANLVKNKKP